MHTADYALAYVLTSEPSSRVESDGTIGGRAGIQKRSEVRIASASSPHSPDTVVRGSPFSLICYSNCNKFRPAA